MIPRYLHPFFWDTDCSRFDPRLFPEYTILRILEYGNSEAVDWLRETFSGGEIAGVIRNERRLSPRSAHFWSLVYEIPKEQVRALRGAVDPLLS